jgi:hypothetical protein
MAQVLVAVEAEHAEPQSASTKKAAETIIGAAQNISTNVLTTSAG